ncbi:MAG: hypothetical protein IJH47_06465 [Oscillospiraceae bacterium]|nr:hypothetical protein [Oscillospiraceae bacterium]
MNNEIKNLCEYFLEEGKKIKLNCPEEIIRLYKYNVVPSGQGCLWDQVFTTMVFAEADLRCMNAYMLWMLARISDDPMFTVDHLKRVFFDTVPLSAEFLGTCGFQSLSDNCDKLKAALKTDITKEEFKNLIEAFTSFVTYYHNWSQFMFPWYVGDLFPRMTADKAEALQKYTAQLK